MSDLSVALEHEDLRSPGHDICIGGPPPACYLFEKDKVFLDVDLELDSEVLFLFGAAAEKRNLNFNQYPIASVKQVPKTLRQVISENDALILLPDKEVINQSSFEYFVTTVLENGFPTLGYNNYPAKSGLLMALTPNPTAIGQQAGDLLCNPTPQPPAIYAPKRFEFAVNSKTADNIRAKLAKELEEWADHVY